MFNLDMV